MGASTSCRFIASKAAKVLSSCRGQRMQGDGQAEGTGKGLAWTEGKAGLGSGDMMMCQAVSRLSLLQNCSCHWCNQVSLWRSRGLILHCRGCAHGWPVAQPQFPPPPQSSAHPCTGQKIKVDGDPSCVQGYWAPTQTR